MTADGHETRIAAESIQRNQVQHRAPPLSLRSISIGYVAATTCNDAGIETHTWHRSAQDFAQQPRCDGPAGTHADAHTNQTSMEYRVRVIIIVVGPLPSHPAFRHSRKYLRNSTQSWEMPFSGI
jgi:hypothetical protein